MIGQYSPNTRSLFEDISKRLGKSKVLPFTIDKTSVVYYPEKSSNPHEFKLYIDELSEIVQNKRFDPIYMLHCENENPDFGDIFTLRIALWYYDFKGKDAASRSSLREKVSSNFAFPNSLGTDRHWSKWICIWTGNSYKLTDMGAKDVEGLTALLTNGIKQTYDQYKLGLKKLAKSRL